MIRVTEIAYTGYPVTNVERARRFYERVLRLTPSVQFEHEGKHWIEYEVGAATLAISNMAADKWKPSADGPSSALEVEDFEAAVKALRSEGVPFAVQPMDSGVCQMAVVLDPDGNAITIHKRRPAQN